MLNYLPSIFAFENLTQVHSTLDRHNLQFEKITELQSDGIFIYLKFIN